MTTETPPGSTTTSSGTLAEIREFFSRTEAPWRVTLVIVATFVGVLIVAWDTARRTRPATTPTGQVAPAHPAPPTKALPR